MVEATRLQSKVKESNPNLNYYLFYRLINLYYYVITLYLL